MTSRNFSVSLNLFPFDSVTLFAGSSNVCTSTESSYVSWSSGDSPSMSMDSPYHTANQNATQLTNSTHQTETGNKVCVFTFPTFFFLFFSFLMIWNIFMHFGVSYFLSLMHMCIYSIALISWGYAFIAMYDLSFEIGVQFQQMPFDHCNTNFQVKKIAFFLFL